MSDRGVSVTLDYIMMLMIATVLLAGVVSVSGFLIDQQVDRGIEDEMTATGEKLAADVQSVEQLVNASNTSETTVQLEVDLPNHVSGERYRISYNESTGEFTLATSSPDIDVQIPVQSDRLVSTEDAISGGEVVIVAENGSIEVRSG